jgi:hypothetical protein
MLFCLDNFLKGLFFGSEESKQMCEANDYIVQKQLDDDLNLLC